ncbi:nickel/cobalt transporter [Falsirhodobacter sp. alg1]|uniref:nickel/cobalt transporter n=1 Tax=Falsirhodobacter sp. alg1 TaxID=1472418 RepID=UPI0005EEA7DE|nr:hypothetical protein [Falsirhodobacter sp. alg1]
MPVILALLAGAALIMLGDHYGMISMAWAQDIQQLVQVRMAEVIHAVRSREPWALMTLCGLCAGYGFVHALGPGHGKVLLSGAALGTNVRPARIFAIGFAASLAQAIAAILLVFVVVGGLRLTSAEASAMAEGGMALASGLAIGAIGALLVWRGIRAMYPRHHHHHHAECGCGHSHGPSVAEVAALTSWRETAALILSVAARPCSGAIFLLVITWRFQILGSGILGVLAMGAGTAALNALAIGGGLAGRRLAFLGARSIKTLPAMQIAAGAAIMGLSLLAVF